ncbi:peptidoglycan D,D-transpeptidase FtsI family protein [Bacillus sp. SCS-151]|uniref:peptidoglycan D,D-transpeptidase FtsI family protein n=1 Tax=Nanhaiella sioensis TaxID=3115293 RepID=UPI00397AA0BD
MDVRKRTINLSVGVIIFIIVLIIRLIQIQLIQTEEFSKHNINLLEASVSQRTQQVVIDQGRGKFVDKNNEPLTYVNQPSLILFPFLKNMDWPIEQVARLINVSPEKLNVAVKTANEPIVFEEGKAFTLTDTQMTEINDLKIPGVFAVNRQNEMPDKIAEHLIGLVREYEQAPVNSEEVNGAKSINLKGGISGLQQQFNEFVLPEAESKLLYHVDGKNGPLFGLEVKYTEPANPFYPVTIKTTIDKEIQIAAEKIVNKHQLNDGGLVLIDIATNDVVAMVSVPSINHSDPYVDDALENRMLTVQTPGSVFKPVIAAAAIEHNLLQSNRIFDCDLDMYGEGKSQYLSGMLNFEESFANSCNYTFSVLALELMELNSQSIEEYATKLGLINPVIWNGDVFHFEEFNQLPYVGTGTIWVEESDKTSPKAIAQTANGQKNVKVTPLAIANMMATIARGGKELQVRVVSDILYKNETTLYSFPIQTVKDNQPLSPYTILKLQQLLRTVVLEGTGRAFQGNSYEVAGKSGTAQLGIKNDDGEELHNKWFAGYFPVQNPKYALVVVDLKQQENNAVTNDVFYEIIETIYEIEQGSS